MASQAEMEDAVTDGRRVLERIEDGFDKLNVVWGRGLALGMMPQDEHDALVARTKVLKEKTLALHVKGTKVAQRNGADGVLPAGGPGR